MEIGGNALDYNGPKKAPTSDIITMKLLLNISLSTSVEKFTTIGMKNFYLKKVLIEKKVYFR